MEPLKGKKVTVLGLGHFGGGIAVSRWLIEQGARVIVCDHAASDTLDDSVQRLNDLPIEFHLGKQRNEDFADADLVVASPAIPPNNPQLAAAQAAGVPISTEIRLFIERCPATIIGITGTKGKSTTTAMLGRILADRFPTWVGGNIGKSLLPELGNIGKSDLVVLELSSYMLQHLGQMKWSPHLAVVTMVTRDHLAWHGSEEAYLEAKSNIVRFQRADDFAVLNEEDPRARAMTHATAARVVLYGVEGRRRFELRLPGDHNQLNAQAAYAAAQVVGVSWDDAQRVLRHFEGLPHRLQIVHQSGGVRYVNDSIATIPEAAIAALKAFGPKQVIQIVGGSEKNLPITDMCAALAERAKAILCIGQTGPKVSAALSESSNPVSAAVYQCGNLRTAMKLAKRIAVAGDVVLLSTGYASYDQFINFEQRGDIFTELAKEMD